MNNNAYNSNPNKKRPTEHISTANMKTQSEDFHSKMKKPRESTSEVKPNYNNTYQNFFKPNVKFCLFILKT